MHLGFRIREKNLSPRISNSSRDNKPYHDTEGRLLNLTTQPCSKLLGDDPYKSVSVAQRRCSKWYPGLENSLWRHMLRAHRTARLGGKWADTVTPPSLFLVWTVGCGIVGLYSFSLSQAGSIPSLLAGPFVQLSVNVSQSICLFIGRTAITHQWAVVQESRGEVGVEAERQDVPFSGAESHFIIWRDKGNSELQGLQTSGSVSGEIIKLVLNCRLSLRTNLWVRAEILTVQPCHTGVMNFELITLQILHGEMGTE